MLVRPRLETGAWTLSEPSGGADPAAQRLSAPPKSGEKQRSSLVGTKVPPATVWADGRYLLAFKPLLVVACVDWPAENGVHMAH